MNFYLNYSINKVRMLIKYYIVRRINEAFWGIFRSIESSQLRYFNIFEQKKLN